MLVLLGVTAFTVEGEAQPKRSLGEASCCGERRSPWLGNPVRTSIADKWWRDVWQCCAHTEQAHFCCFFNPLHLLLLLAATWLCLLQNWKCSSSSKLPCCSLQPLLKSWIGLNVCLHEPMLYIQGVEICSQGKQNPYPNYLCSAVKFIFYF